MNGRCEYEEIEGTCNGVCEPKFDQPQSDVLCPKHLAFEYRVCQGCGNAACRECGHEDPQASPQVCRAPLCNLCRHFGQGHTSEPPSEPQSAPTGQAAIDALRSDMRTSIRDSVLHAIEHQIPIDSAAELILNNLLLHVTFQMLSGMAAHPPE